MCQVASLQERRFDTYASIPGGFQMRSRQGARSLCPSERVRQIRSDPVWGPYEQPVPERPCARANARMQSSASILTSSRTLPCNTSRFARSSTMRASSRAAWQGARGDCSCTSACAGNFGRSGKARWKLPPTTSGTVACCTNVPVDSTVSASATPTHDRSRPGFLQDPCRVLDLECAYHR